MSGNGQAALAACVAVAAATVAVGCSSSPPNSREVAECLREEHSVRADLDETTERVAGERTTVVVNETVTLRLFDEEHDAQVAEDGELNRWPGGPIAAERHILRVGPAVAIGVDAGAARLLRDALIDCV